MIVYVNLVLEKAVGRSSIPVDLVKSVEEEYSEERVRSIQFEWASIFPSLEVVSKVLENRRDSFRVQEIASHELEAIAMELLSYIGIENEPLAPRAQCFLNQNLSANSFRYEIVNCLYHVGMVGIKKGPQSPVKWSFESGSIAGPVNLKPDTRVYVQPMVWRRFEISGGEN